METRQNNSTIEANGPLVELPLEILVMIAHSCFAEDIPLALAMRLTCVTFNNVTEEASKQLIKQYWGEPTQTLTEKVHPASYASSFFKLFKQDTARLILTQRFLTEGETIYAGRIKSVNLRKDMSSIFKNKEGLEAASRKKIEKLNLNALSMAEQDIIIPETLFFFVSSAVNARAYETLAMLVAAIRDSERKAIPLNRVIDTIYGHAACEYDELEFARLMQFIPKNINELVCQTIIGQSLPPIMLRRPLLHIVAVNKKLGLVKYLLSIGADLNLADEKNTKLLDFLDAKLKYDAVLKEREKLEEVYLFLKQHHQSQIMSSVLERKPQ